MVKILGSALAGVFLVLGPYGAQLALGASPDRNRSEARKAPPHARVAQIYGRRCSGCHGNAGDGRGPVSHFLTPRPRSFVEAEYKIRSTPGDHVPLDGDLARTIKKGMPGTAMPGFEGDLSDSETRLLVDVLRNFSPRFDVDGFAKPVQVPAAPLNTPGTVAAGRQVYERLGCVDCHGAFGRGDGRLATGLLDSDQLTVRPRDFSLPGMLKGGSSAADIYRTLATGLDGTPMVALDGSVSDLERWQLAYFIQSLSMQPVLPVRGDPRSGE